MEKLALAKQFWDNKQMNPFLLEYRRKFDAGIEISNADHEFLWKKLYQLSEVALTKFSSGRKWDEDLKHSLQFKAWKVITTGAFDASKKTSSMSYLLRSMMTSIIDHYNLVGDYRQDRLVGDNTVRYKLSAQAAEAMTDEEIDEFVEREVDMVTRATLASPPKRLTNGTVSYSIRTRTGASTSLDDLQISKRTQVVHRCDQIDWQVLSEYIPDIVSPGMLQDITYLVVECMAEIYDKAAKYDYFTRAMLVELVRYKLWDAEVGGVQRVHPAQVRLAVELMRQTYQLYIEEEGIVDFDTDFIVWGGTGDND